MAYIIRTNIDPSATSGTELADVVEEVGDLTQIVVESDTSNQPGGPSEGDAYIVNGDASWVNGSQYDVAVFRDSTWIYHTPEEGWVAYIKDRSESRRFNGTDWNSRLPDSSPEHATDSGTDAYVSATNTDTPKEGDQIVRDFQSANGTTTPTLDSNTLTTRDGSALWAGALSGVHELQLNAGGTGWLVLDPNPIDEDDMASDSDAAVPTQQSAKAYADTKLAAPGTSTNPALAFDTWRTPNANRATSVVVNVTVGTDGTTAGVVALEVDESGGTTSDYSLRGRADEGLGSAGFTDLNASVTIPAGGSYRIVNTSDPQGVNTVSVVREFTL